MPRPIALITTISPEGKINAAPFSFFNVLGAEPPILAVAPGDRDDGTPKDTARNILFLIGRMASPYWYCRTRDRFELIRPK